MLTVLSLWLYLNMGYTKTLHTIVCPKSIRWTKNYSSNLMKKSPRSVNLIFSMLSLYQAAISGGVDISEVSGCHLLQKKDEFSVRVIQITSRISVSWTHSLLFWFRPLFLTQWNGHIIKSLIYPHGFQMLVLLS